MAWVTGKSKELSNLDLQGTSYWLCISGHGWWARRTRWSHVQ